MIHTIQDIQDLQNQRVFVRVDFNVPFDKAGHITDDSRIQGALPTIQHLLRQGARVILASHLGRPKGLVNDSLRLTPVSNYLQSLLPNTPIQQLSEVFSPNVLNTVNSTQPGSITVLENVRFEPKEEKNDPEFAKQLASLADIYVNDAFGAAHRAHASTEGIAHHVKTSVAGLLMAREIEALSSVVNNPAHPLTAIIGGSKVSSKITVIESLMQKVDHLIIGGAMMFTFLKAQGYNVGNSMVEDDHLETASKLLKLADETNTQLLLPREVVLGKNFAADTECQTVSSYEIPSDWIGLDIGPKAVNEISDVINASKTVLWNGPMGVFEMEAFAPGTRGIADALISVTKSGSTKTILGGGDTVAAIELFDIPKTAYTHVSTGGGASLEFLEGKPLPGINALNKVSAAV